MFDKLIRELKKMERMQVSVPIQTDADGYYDKECPSENCLFQFKVFAGDWGDKFKDESVYCPLCGHNAPADSFWTTEQIEQSENKAYKYLEGRLKKAFADNAKDFNRRQPRRGFITMRMEYKGTRSNFIILPIPSQKELQQKIACSNCNAKYAVLGSAFFCPCCGYNSVIETFDNSIKKIETKIKNLDLVRRAVSEISEDEAEITIRSLIESGLSDGVVAFQRFCELIYKQLQDEKKKIKFNAFQNLEIGGNYWHRLFGESYNNWLEPEEYKRLNILFQRRHLLAHCEGIVDQKYLDNSGDNSYTVGQRIVVKKKDVTDLVFLIRKIINRIRELGRT
ncbi:MAG: hypothetical protein K8R79_06435 [Calditrichales bacterium]|nr:hypothetical protein [Calditrichales bacterium]